MNGSDKKPPPIPVSPETAEAERSDSPPLLSEGQIERRKTSPYGEGPRTMGEMPSGRPTPLPNEVSEYLKDASSKPRNEPPLVRRTLRPGAVQSLVFEMVRAVLQRHIGPATVEGLLTMACKRSGVASETMRVHELDLLMEELMPSIRTLCDAERLPQLLAELDQLHQLHG
jgi:hypothetical protein